MEKVQEMWIQGVRLRLPNAIWTGAETAVLVDQESLQAASKELAIKLTTFISGELQKGALGELPYEDLMKLFVAARHEMEKRGYYP